MATSCWNVVTTVRTSASRSMAGSSSHGSSGYGSTSATRYGSLDVWRLSRMRSTPCTASCIVPSGIFSRCWTRTIVPMWRTSSQLASSTCSSYCAATASVRSPGARSSSSRSERGLPTPSGTSTCGNTTVFLSGSTGSTSGSCSSGLVIPGAPVKSRWSGVRISWGGSALPGDDHAVEQLLEQRRVAVPGAGRLLEVEQVGDLGLRELRLHVELESARVALVDGQVGGAPVHLDRRLLAQLVPGRDRGGHQLARVV